MADWKETLGKFVNNAEDHFDLLKYRLRERLGRRDPVMIQPYRGFGTQERIYVKGRVLEDEGITPAAANDDIWDNLLNMYRRFESDEIPHAHVRVSFQGESQEVQADEEGYFEVWIEPSRPLPIDRVWHTVELELVSPLRPNEEPATAQAQVLVPPPGAQYGVISDIDDTVLQTDAASLLRMARTVFLSNARTRLPFKGVAAFYRAMFAAPHGGAFREVDNPIPFNPLFYVSSSPWNLYDLLSDFFHIQEIPIGPVLFLRDWGISENELLPTEHKSYKLGVIRRVIDTYKDLPFILLGDSGQEDPEIYEEVVRKYPNRVEAIYIRNVSRGLKRPEAIEELAKRVTDAGSALILADNTVPMAEHAAGKGWIVKEDLPSILVEKEEDEAPPTPVEKALGLEEAEGEEEPAPTVVVDAGTREETKEAVEEGAIEEALEVEEEETREPPAVVIDADEPEDEPPGQN